MITISITFTRAASAKTGIETGFSTFWMLVWAVAIDDDAKCCEKERRRERQRQQSQPPHKPKSPAGPRPF